ncbi:uridylate kinase [Aspergillus rambellii]|uniref:Uridylate kinase n=1 Tax=Aspergillus rambellii TaxID=308745 RepID=A0A0F8WX35_9EURO|nr:uridylate kinase [Aspergillus rambellii]
MTPRFSPHSTTVVFLLGGPGSGKGTQSTNLVRDYGFTHLSAGDLLRAEQIRPGSEYGELIRSYIREGQIVPMEITVALLSNAMAAAASEASDEQEKEQEEKVDARAKRFLIDGFPRQLDQAVFFEATVCPSDFTLFLDCPEQVMEARLLKRGETSGRDDDNADSIRKRFRTFVQTSMPVVEAFAGQDKVVSVSAVGGVDEVYARIRGALEGRGVMAV